MADLEDLDLDDDAGLWNSAPSWVGITLTIMGISVLGLAALVTAWVSSR